MELRDLCLQVPSDEWYCDLRGCSLTHGRSDPTWSAQAREQVLGLLHDVARIRELAGGGAEMGTQTPYL